VQHGALAVTPAALGQGWKDDRVALDLVIDWNGQRFGQPMAARWISALPNWWPMPPAPAILVAGTVIGSGTVSNPEYATVGSSCISERRAIEIIADGKPTTAFMAFGDTVRMEARGQDGTTPFGAIAQQVVQAG
jgi:fumarylacetoacetate (FAA) hydrolase